MGCNRYLVVSDLHICDIEDHDDGWKRHKSSQFVYDAAFDAMIQGFTAKGAPDDVRTLVLNGDIFDFDLVTAVPEDPPWPVSPIERQQGLDATEAKSVWKLEHMLADHPQLLVSLARFMAAGHRVVYILGNHDREMVFEAAQAAFVRALVEAGEAHALTIDPALLVFEPWFWLAHNDVYVEHGHQYDFYSAFRYNLDPMIEKGGERQLALPMGNLSNRFLMSNIGYFNPHATDYILTLFGYVRHWLQYYAFSKRSIILVWFLGSIRSMLVLLGTRRRLVQHPPKDYEARKDVAAARYGLDPVRVRRIYDLRQEPITSRVYKIMREFWIDRVLIAVAMTGGTVALALSDSALWVKLVVPLLAFPLAHLVYEMFAGDDNALTVELESHRYAHRIATELPVRAVVFGHTHVPSAIPLGRGVTFANSGTWAPIWEKDRTTLTAGLRNYVEITATETRCEVEVGSWLPLEAGAGAGMAEERPRR